MDLEPALIQILSFLMEADMQIHDDLVQKLQTSNGGGWAMSVDGGVSYAHEGWVGEEGQGRLPE